MTRNEVRQRFVDVVNLINYCQEKKIESFTLMYALNKNYKILKDAEDAIVAVVSPELKELEEKITALGKTIETSQPMPDFEKGLTIADEKDVKRHTELFKEFKKFLEEEETISLYTIPMDKVEDLKMDFMHTAMLSHFIK